ncbi:Card1-like endonuclease domain-containing protein [Neisseria dentiae]|uniref:Card1-like endonuclease domain-containing protein n=1 Tax=Neisseria dentiae TaxID=194197 RepID=UPI0035A064DF
MKKFDVHVCLVSDQAVPNFVPVLDKDFRPQEVVLLVTEQMQAGADALAEVMRKSCGVKVRQLAVADAYDMAQVGERVFALLCDMDKEQVALNVTGGTKLMAIAAFAMFKEAGYPSFYFTADSNEVLLLDNNERLLLQPPKIKIEDYLMLHGYPARHKLQKQLAHPEWLPFAEELVRAHGSLGQELGRLNFEISQTDKRVLKCKVPAGAVARNMQYLLNLLEENGLARQQGDCLLFAGEEAKQYAAGGWFEDYVFQTAKSLPGVQDIALNVQIENAKEQVFQHNELDVLLLVGNVLHVLECKTANFATHEDKAEEALYKLESLKKLGGLRTKAMLLSYRELTGKIRNRAMGAQIGIIEQKDLSGMKTLLEKWANGR